MSRQEIKSELFRLILKYGTYDSEYDKYTLNTRNILDKINEIYMLGSCEIHAYDDNSVNWWFGDEGHIEINENKSITTSTGFQIQIPKPLTFYPDYAINIIVKALKEYYNE